ncbi:DMT family transporter [soil metagenome]
MRRSQLILVHGSLVLTAMLWGGNFSAIKELLKTLEPLDVVFLRAFGALSFFITYLVLSRKPFIPMARQDLWRLLVIGVVGITVMNLTMTFGQKLLPAALASLIVTSNPVFTVLVAAALGHEIITRRTVTGVALAFAGFLIVLLYGTGSSADFGGSQYKGVVLVLIAPLSWAFYTVLSKPLLSKYPPFHVAAYTAIAGTISFMSIPFVQSGTISRISDLDRRGWGAAVFASVLAYALAYFLWYKGLESLTPSQTAIYIYLVPVFGVLSAWLVLGEEITPWLVLGGATILTGVAITNMSRRRRRPLSVIPERAVEHTIDGERLPVPASAAERV